METIKNWRQHPFHNEILNRIWKLFPRLVLWNIWKEINRQIFKQATLPLPKVCLMIKSNLLESVHIHPWTQEDLKCPPSEILILKNRGFHLLTKTLHVKLPQPKASIPDSWAPPAPRFLKLNFDGASKGNLGLRRIGGVFRNKDGEIEHVFAESIGITTNNVAELQELLSGLEIANKNSWNMLEVEGDSHIIINTVKKTSARYSPHQDNSKLETRMDEGAAQKHASQF